MTLQLEGHHLLELSRARARQVDDFDGDEAAIEPHARAAHLEASGLELGLEEGSRVVAGFEGELVQLPRPRDGGEGQPSVVNEQTCAGSHDGLAITRQDRMTAPISDERPPLTTSGAVGCAPG